MTPLYLHPNEKLKFSSSIQRESFRRSLDDEGRSSKLGVGSDQTFAQFSAAAALDPSSSVGLTLQGQAAAAEDSDSVAAWRDLSLAARYTILQQTIANAWMPRVDLNATYKAPLGKSIFDNGGDSSDSSLTSNGYQEVVLGVYGLFGMEEWQIGSGLQVGRALPRTLSLEGNQHIRLEPGNFSLMNAEVFYQWIGFGTAGVAFDYEVHGLRHQDGEEVPDSDIRNAKANMSMSYRLASQTTWGLRLGRTGLLTSKNTQSAAVASISYTRSF